ncbi:MULTISPECIES: efflux RND transporter periplasmic adaptor subunit [Brevibacillus]|jgi:HlyD family secretion protein|uniref:Efflux RND transporter periplasmic adaptor subunit n=1 Tax=Brevibacillus thermoruber TaxID=33942 RepID=A0A9X3TSQ1_9BACL|nr:MULTISPECIES: efflux RND transporter periplasmic adaptor subunit [Brevibacillus]MDA5109725.1 efflux RND transporter periplasmic adaptor subunit [Brevibacillus thermoruber]TRY27130.1 efflux RND transporter periplasmic adaptor subunit [Brevibacillus sp. LEMMJ03]UYZ14606.1 efflux RND transporter periplasmic adaptor subunit [Brevibacillus sp. WF146]
MKMNKGSLGLLLALAVALAGCTAPDAATQQTQTENKPVPVQVDTVKKGSVSTRAGVTGKLAPNKEVTLAPKVSGKIVQLNVKLGQYVQKGQVLFSLEKTDLVNAVQQAQAAYDLAVANLKQSDATTSQGLQQAKNGLVQAEQALRDAERNYQRMSELYNQGAVSPQQLEQAQATLTNAQTAYANAKQALEAAEKRTGVAVTQASVEQARVSLENAREQLANATVTAPISGFVSAVNGQVGEMASPQSPVVTIVDTDPLIVKANLSEEEVTSVKKGDKVKIQISALSKELDGTVSAISPVMDQTLRAYPVEISLAKQDASLKADMVVSIQFAKQQAANMLVVPLKAVFDENGKRFVYKLEGDTAKKVEVQTGTESSDLVEVKAGLKEGEKIVVRGQTLLKDGAKVHIQPTS